MIDSRLIKHCVNHSWNNLFPKKVKNKKIVYFINILHIFGIFAIQFGIFLPPKYLKFYVFYLLFLLVTYIILKNRCFMTELSNYFAQKYYDSLCIKMSQAKFILFLYLFYACLSIINPSISLYHMIKTLVYR